MRVPYIDVNFIGNVIFLAFGGSTWIPSTGKTLYFSRFLLSLYLTTNMNNIVAFCFKKVPVLLRQSCAFQLRYWSHSEQRSYKVSDKGSGEKAHAQSFHNQGALRGYKHKSLEDFILLKANVPKSLKNGKRADSYGETHNYKELSLWFWEGTMALWKHIPSLFIFLAVTLRVQFLTGLSRRLFTHCTPKAVEVYDRLSIDFNPLQQWPRKTSRRRVSRGAVDCIYCCAPFELHASLSQTIFGALHSTAF